MKYAEIIAQHKSQRNVLEVKLRKIIKINKDTNEKMDPPKNLTIDDLSEIIFETMNIQFKDCLGVDYYTGRYDNTSSLWYLWNSPRQQGPLGETEDHHHLQKGSTGEPQPLCDYALE